MHHAVDAEIEDVVAEFGEQVLQACQQTKQDLGGKQNHGDDEIFDGELLTAG